MDHPTRRLAERPGDDTAPDARATRHLARPVPGPPTICPRCDGEVARFPTRSGTSRGGPLVVVNLDGPREIWQGLQPARDLWAYVCLDCGYTELYTDQPRRLLS